MKRGALTRRTPLRRTRINPVSAKGRAKIATWIETRKEVMERDQHQCQLCLSEGRTRRASDGHHIIHRSQGGKHTRDNAIALCRACHDRAHLTESPSHWRPLLQALVAASEARAALRSR